MCSSPICPSAGCCLSGCAWRCVECGRECAEDDTDGCPACLPERIDQKLDELRDLLKEASDYLARGVPIHLMKRNLLWTEDIIPVLIDRFIPFYDGDFDEQAERARLREVPR